jgi:DNA primase
LKFSLEFVDKVRDANNIVDVLSQYSSFKHTGRDHVGLCPFPDHKEKTPSFSVSENKQVYYCFGCKKSGNIINFLMDYNGMSFPESVEYLANRASIPLPEENSQGNNRKNERKSDKTNLLKLNLMAGAYFKNELAKLPETHPAKVYLKNRGLTQEIIETFKIGFSPEGWDNLVKYFLSKKAPMALTQSLGLTRQKPYKKEYYDIFRNRIMFPILSPKGEVLGFGARTIANENPKYLNSPESEVFHKGKVLYGLNEAAKHIRIEDQVIVVEGYMDLVTLYQYGFKNAVASLGTALTLEHAKLLKRSTKNILVLFDSDQAGQFAQERSLPILLAEGLLPKSISLGDSKDPDEFLRKHGADAFRDKLKSASDLFFVIWNRISKGLSDSPTDKVHKFELIAPYLLSTEDLSLKELYIQELASTLNVTPEWILKALKKIKSPESTNFAKSNSVPEEKASPEVSFEKIKITNPLKEEVFLVNLALAKQEMMDELIEWGLENKLTKSGLDLVFKKAADEYRQNPTIFATLTSNLCSLINDPSVITKHLDQDWESNLDIQKLKTDCLQRLETRFSQKEARFLVNEIKLDNDPQKLEQFMNVIRSRHAIKQLKD